MDVLHIQPEQAVRLTELPSGPCVSGFYWLDLTHDEFVSEPEALRDRVQSLGNARIYDLHMQDAANLQHPSFFDSTSDYDMLIFRKLTPGEDRSLRPLEDLDFSSSTVHKPMHRLQEITTKPVTFFLFERLLVTGLVVISCSRCIGLWTMLDEKSRSSSGCRLRSSPGVSLRKISMS